MATAAEPTKRTWSYLGKATDIWRQPPIMSVNIGFWNVRRTGSAMDVGLQRAAELGLDIFFLGEIHIDKDRNNNLQVKKHAGYECVSSIKEGTKVAAYVASELMGAVEVLAEEDNWVVVKVGDIRV